MPRRSRRRTPRRSSAKKKKKRSGGSATTWAVNIVIAVLTVVVVSFVYSSIMRIQVNEHAVDLSLEESIEKYEKTLAEQLYEQKEFPDVWVEVLNGNGVPGVAAEYTEFLREEGFDVQNTENADNFSYENTLVIARSENRQKAYAVARALQIDTSRVQSNIDPSLQLDVTVILGDDYNTISIYDQVKAQSLP
ncbi:MAG: hypothetical protein GF372_02390 [Candidatus Marinimicrobia bacterium]|nr:hypothetical protein [Candidatus Neomarinimicrobiota bacterium]